MTYAKTVKKLGRMETLIQLGQELVDSAERFNRICQGDFMTEDEKEEACLDYVMGDEPDNFYQVAEVEDIYA